MRKIIVFILLALIGLTACKKDNKKIVVATDSTWPPMEYINEKKELVGFDIDFFNAIGKAVNKEIEFKSVGWDGIFSGLDGGKYDAIISSVTITDERKQTYDFSLPYINAGQVIIVRTSDINKTTMKDFEGLSMGAQIGTTGAQEIAKYTKITLKNYDELGFAIEDLVNKRIDGVVCDYPIAANFALQNENYKGKIVISCEPFTSEFYGIVVKKGNTQLLDVINEGIEKVRSTDEYQQLVDKWLK